MIDFEILTCMYHLWYALYSLQCLDTLQLFWLQAAIVFPSRKLGIRERQSVVPCRIRHEVDSAELPTTL